jgi:hypothetical protein
VSQKQQRCYPATVNAGGNSGGKSMKVHIHSIVEEYSLLSFLQAVEYAKSIFHHKISYNVL